MNDMSAIVIFFIYVWAESSEASTDTLLAEAWGIYSRNEFVYFAEGSRKTNVGPSQTIESCPYPP